MVQTETDIIDQIKDLVRSKKFDQLEELWLQVIEGEKRPLSFHQNVIKFLLNKKEEERLGALYSLLIQNRAERGEPEQAMSVIRMLLEFDPTLDFVRPLIASSAKALHPDRDAAKMEEIFKNAGIADAPDVRKAFARLQELLGASRGQVFKHSQWGLGVVRELDSRENSAIVDFPKKPGHKMTLEGIKNFLERVPDDHILARIARDPAEFKAEMFEDPAEAIKLALRSVRGNTIKMPDLKRLLTDGFLTENDFKRWWNKAKDEALVDPYIEMKGKGASAQLFLRKEPRSFVDEVVTRMLAATKVTQRREVLRDIGKHGSRADFTEADAAAIWGLFEKPLVDGTLKTDEQKFPHGLLFIEFSDLFAEDAKNPVDVDAILKASNAVAKLVVSAEALELQRIALQRVEEIMPEKVATVFPDVFLDADPRLGAWMEKELAQRGMQDARDECVERILARPLRNPDLFAWAARGVLEDKFPHVTESLPSVMLLEELVSVLAQLADTPVTGDGPNQAEHTANKFRVILQENQNKHVKKAIRKATIEEARKFLACISLSGNAVTSQLRSAMEQIILAEHPELRSRNRAEEEEERRKPQYHYTTAASVERKRQELSTILNVHIPENSKAIGVAREMGDLRENAEYHAAKDRQKLYMQQAAELEELIARARIVEADQIRTDDVRFGTRVQLRAADGTTESHTLLGMWEADANKNIISYMTPSGSQLMNRRVGEQFKITYPDGRTAEFEVVSIEKAI